MVDIMEHVCEWVDFLSKEKDKLYFKNIFKFLDNAVTQGKIIYPKRGDIFNCLKYTKYKDVKVVIIGQDPYHQPLQAHGLAFSVQDGVKIPASLVNIFKEINDDLGIKNKNGCLIPWAERGVLLLNSSLSVEKSRPASHSNIGWDKLTDAIISSLNHHKYKIVFLLWGSYAQSKLKLIDSDKHCVLTCPHPSPLSAYRGFFGCKHFSKANKLLMCNGRKPIDWQL